MVSELLAGLTIDVSPYAVDIGKHIASKSTAKSVSHVIPIGFDICLFNHS